MTTPHLPVLGAALAAGLLGDLLLRVGPPGLNGFLWVALLLLFLAAAARRAGVALSGEGRWLAVPALFFAGAMAWRDAGGLLALDMLAVLASLAMVALYARGGELRLGGVTEYVYRAMAVGLQTMGGLFPVLAHEVPWQEIPRGRWSRPAMAVLKGLLIALPLVLVFGALLTAADPVFEKLVAGWLDFSMEDWFSHAGLFLFWAWVAGGFLRTALISTARDLQGIQRPETRSLGPIETGIALGTLNALFLAFVLVQFRYFFGGAALVVASTGLTYAEYARRGFFELVTVSALVLPLLLLAHWVLLRDRPGAERLFRWLAGVMVALLAVIMVSAVHRMLLYQQAYGLTELRLYATAGMGWLALVFLWFALTVLRGRRDRFAFGALAAGYAVLAALHFINPDALIARTNVDGTAYGRPLDAMYIELLSADAVPVLMEALPQMGEAEQRRLAEHLLSEHGKPDDRDWRTLNWGRERARAAVAGQRRQLEAMAGWK